MISTMQRKIFRGKNLKEKAPNLRNFGSHWTYSA